MCSSFIPNSGTSVSLVLESEWAYPNSYSRTCKGMKGAINLHCLSHWELGVVLNPSITDSFLTYTMGNSDYTACEPREDIAFADHLFLSCSTLASWVRLPIFKITIRGQVVKPKACFLSQQTLYTAFTTAK